MTKETYFEELSYALRRRELLPRPLEEDGLLPVEWNGRILCRVTESGVVRYDPTWVDTSRAKAVSYTHLSLEDFPEEEAKWLIPGWIPAGQISVIAADGGIGKTTLWCHPVSYTHLGQHHHVRQLWLRRQRTAGQEVLCPAYRLLSGQKSGLDG